MTDNRMRLVAGLGNPGKAYAITRHNAGFMVVDALSADCGIDLNREKFDARYARCRIHGVDTLVVKPMAFMNRSGPPIKNIANYFRILCEDMIIVHDDIDLALGRLKIKQKGGHGGHKGVKSIMDTFGGGDFTRLRLGIGRPEAGIGVTDHVLYRFTASETDVVRHMVELAREAIVTVLCKGTRAGMNRFNVKGTVISR